MYEMEGPQLGALASPAGCPADFAHVTCTARGWAQWHRAASRPAPLSDCSGTGTVLAVNEFLRPPRQRAQGLSPNNSMILFRSRLRGQDTLPLTGLTGILCWSPAAHSKCRERSVPRSACACPRTAVRPPHV